MDPNEKLQLDDITLDDIISGEGVTTIDAEVEKPTEEKIEETQDKQPEEKVEEPTLEEEVVQEEKIDKVELKDETDDDVESDEKKEDETVVSEIIGKLGYELEGDYSDTTEGLIEMTKEVASKMADDRLDEVLENFPLVKDHLQYVLSGGQSQEFMKAYDPNLDYNTFKLEENDTRSQKAILSDYFAVKGHDKDFINEMLEDYEDSGKLHAKAEAARAALGKAQESQRTQLVEQQRKSRDAQHAEQQKFWNEIAETIKTSKEFQGLVVPEKEKSKFFNYLSRPVTREGYTQRDLDHSDAAVDVKLAIDYLMYKGFNLNDIINTKAKTKQSKSLREKILKNEETVKSARKTSRSKKNFDIDDLDLSI